MKKLYYVIGLIFCSIQAFPNSNMYKYGEETWTILILSGIILFIILTYLFLHAYFEQLLRNKEIQKINEEEEDEKSEYNPQMKESPISKTSDELLNLFMLKRKGVITEIEYQKLKDRLMKSRQGSKSNYLTRLSVS